MFSSPTQTPLLLNLRIHLCLVCQTMMRCWNGLFKNGSTLNSDSGTGLRIQQRDNLWRPTSNSVAYSAPKTSCNTLTVSIGFAALHVISMRGGNKRVLISWFTRRNSANHSQPIISLNILIFPSVILSWSYDYFQHGEEERKVLTIGLYKTNPERYRPIILTTLSLDRIISIQMVLDINTR